LHLRCDHLESLAGLRNAPNLEALALESVQSSLDLSELAFLKKLKALWLFEVDTSESSQNLRILGELSSVEYLAIGLLFGEDADLAFVAEMPNLKALDASGLSLDQLLAVAAPEDSSFRRIEVLTLHATPSAKLGGKAFEQKVIEVLRNAERLKELDLSIPPTALPGVAESGVFDRLVALRLEGRSPSPNQETRQAGLIPEQDALPDLAFLAGLPSLRTLDLSRNATVGDLSALKEVPTLRVLQLPTRPSEENYRQLFENGILQRLQTLRHETNPW
jgi:Leucine-rich repeat (LRR) protein